MRHAVSWGSTSVAVVVVVLLTSMRPVEGQQGSFQYVKSASALELSDDLHSEFWEDVGSLSTHDGGRTIFITSDRHHERDKVGSGEIGTFHFDLFVATRDDRDAPFSVATNGGIVENVNSAHDECSSTISADGLTLAWFSNRPVDGGEWGTINIWAAKREQVLDRGEEVPFGEPFPLGINSESADWMPYFSANMETIYFASNRKEPDSRGQTPFGAFDLYQATLNPDGSYSKVINLGGSETAPFDQFVNSPARETSPVVFEDGLRMFFSENPPDLPDHPARNGSDADIWVATRSTLDEPFGNVRSLGSPVNSRDFHETAFHISADWPAEGAQIWFTRVQNGTADIYMATWVHDKPFRRGDASGDGGLDLTDGVAILNFLFAGASQPECLDAADTDDDGAVQINDAVGLLNYLFSGGPPPPAPFEECGADPTDDDFLHCPISPCP